jgi:hypothetical protein
MPIITKYLFVASMDVDPDKEELFNEVYDTEHVPNLLMVPGVHAVTRLKGEPFTVSIGGAEQQVTHTGPRYSALYEISVGYLGAATGGAEPRTGRANIDGGPGCPVRHSQPRHAGRRLRGRSGAIQSPDRGGQASRVCAGFPASGPSLDLEGEGGRRHVCRGHLGVCAGHAYGGVPRPRAAPSRVATASDAAAVGEQLCSSRGRRGLPSGGVL